MLQKREEALAEAKIALTLQPEDKYVNSLVEMLTEPSPVRIETQNGGILDV